MSLLEEEPFKIIDGIKFGILSPNDFRKLSVVEVQMADTYDEDGVPITSGLMDGRFGTLEPRQRCKTCGNTAARCPGHFGHIELSVPVVHVGFSKLIYKLLRVTCRNCGRLLLAENIIIEYKEKMAIQEQMLGTLSNQIFKEVEKKAIKSQTCPHCATKQLKTKFSKPTTFQEELEEGGINRLTPSMIRERLERISNDDLKVCGLDPDVARPEWMILRVLPVPPVYVRPSITLETGIRSEDDLTHKLVDILRINQRLRENIEAGAPALIVQDLSELLQYHITTYFDNEVSGIPPARHRSGRALKTLSQRLKGKEGRFRSNLSGKRVDFSARTVISPDSNLDINEVGVPIEIAKRLTVPERVTQWNIEKMKNYVINGPNNYPGALYIVRHDGKRLRLEFVTEREKIAEALQPGFIIERHIGNEDIVIFNRQPSLHRMSIMAHKVKVLPYKTFRLHLCTCPPYNADFDGDEMNLHVPQSVESQTEARLLMMVQDQILTPRYGGPIIGPIRDYITAAYVLTKKSTKLNRMEMCRLLSAANYSEKFIPEPIVKEPEQLWSGKQIFSLFIPDGLNYVSKSNLCQQCAECEYTNCPNDAYVVVKNGVLERGVIDKSSIGAEKSESLYHRIVKDYGTESGRKFLNSMCKLLTEFITMKGFTYSLDELDLSKKVLKKIDKIINKGALKVSDLISDYQQGILTRLPGQTSKESLEIYVMNELSKVRDEAGNIADESFGIENHGIIMTKTGARGSSLNIGQMTACLGQQAVRGRRIARGYKDRTLPHFQTGDLQRHAKGFIDSCYRDGLDPIEFFFHAMGGREGLVDTAVRTQQSGYMQRRLINALEYLRVENDSTVRDSEGNVIEFQYGEDGIDPAKSDHGKAVNIKQLIEMMKIMFNEGDEASEAYIKKYIKSVEKGLNPFLATELTNQILKTKLTKKAVDEIIPKIVESYNDALVEPGEAVGIIAAQSIGEPGTQMTLRTFHYAGVKEMNVTLGLPRLIEIVDARRKPSTPTMKIFLDEEHRKTKESATKVAKEIVFTTVEDLATIYIDMLKASIIVQLDASRLEDRDVLKENFEEAINIANCDINISDDHIILTPTAITDLTKLHGKVASTPIKGVSGIRRALVTKERGEWLINTDGSNLSKILKVQGVDTTRTITNDIHEISAVLGIEAARNSLIEEARSVLEEQGLDVDVRHVMLVADIMTSRGQIYQVGRHGVSGKKSSVLAKAAFEITIPTIIEAASKGTVDVFKGATESVIVGQNIPVGTGLIELYMGLKTT
ncbi:MAG: DNA-directed RNA polymerase subunit A' [Candidatus Bathyarchaeota archaeon]|nr:MAG: DNA-directed RNA polymerase subunit A' [Candidatus Bathyarchaeota archaeon]